MLAEYGYAGLIDVSCGRVDLGLIQREIDGHYTAYHGGRDLGTFQRQRDAVLALVDRF